MPKDVNWTNQIAPAKGAPVMEIHTVRAGGNPIEFIEGEALTAMEAASNGTANGDNPTYSMPPFANGEDKRNRG